MSPGSRITLVAASLVLVFLAGTAAYYAPRFLIYADKPVKSDAIILFVGNNSSAREKEAYYLLNEGYARYLIVPAFHEVFMHGNAFHCPSAPGSTNSRGFKGYPGFYENTHIEALYAKKMMDAMGLESAVMISSPYHMRRIRMISKRVFGAQARFISYSPTRYAHDPADVREMGRADWMFVIQEFIKICWFRLYSPFVGNGLRETLTSGGVHGYAAY